MDGPAGPPGPTWLGKSPLTLGEEILAPAVGAAVGLVNRLMGQLSARTKHPSAAVDTPRTSS